MISLPADFFTYIAPETDRASFIQEWLLKNGVSSNLIVIDGKKHILVQYGSEKYNPSFRIKTVVAHYDRVENSPGANDNSAADWILMNWAVQLQNKIGFHNVRIIFTDGEELGKNGVREQGAFALASTFRRLGIKKDDVYVFDACGRGSVAVLSKTSVPKNAPEDFKKQFNSLFLRAQNLLLQSNPHSYLTLPLPYSDNASFIAVGIPAVAITMLPKEEAFLYAKNLMDFSNLENFVTNKCEFKAQKFNLAEKLPLTWRLFHSQSDSAETLQQEAFDAMNRILFVLENSKTPLV